MRLSFFLYLLLVAAPVYAEKPDTEKETPFATIMYPSVASSGEEIEVHVTLRTNNVTEPVDLFVDMHGIMGQGGERKAGLGTQKFTVRAGDESAFVAKFTVPELSGMTRLAFPVYIAPPGQGWGQKIQNTEVATKIQ